MNIKKKNSDIFLIIVLVLTFFVLALGVTWTLFSVMSSQEINATKIYSGMLEISYREIDITNEMSLIPINEPEYGKTDYVYTNRFSIESNGTIDQTITIYLEISENNFSNNALHYKLYNSSATLVGTGTIPSSGNVNLIENVSFPQSGIENYTLMVWLQETNDNQDIDRKKSLIGTIKVTSTQITY